MNLKNALRALTLIPLSVYLLYCSYYAITHDVVPKYMDCGKVVSKSNDEVSIKHGVRTELYLNVQFEKSGFYSVEVSPTTYFLRKKGDRVCFKLPEPVSVWHKLNHLIGFTVLIILSIIALVMLIIYLLPDNFFD
jgi:hypothetical protein